MLLFSALLLLFFGWVFTLPLLSGPLIMALIYYWSQINPNEIVTYMFGIRFKSRYLPWVMIGFNILLGGNPFSEIIGIIVGHIYYLLVDRIPKDYGYNLIQTPGFIKRFFPDEDLHFNRQENHVRSSRYNWGTGMKLGSGSD